MIITPEQFDTGVLMSAGLVKAVPGEHKRKHHNDYFNIVTAFDIETTTLTFPGEHNSHSFMYIWQWHFSGYATVVGRTWDEFKTLSLKIQDFCYFYQTLFYTENPPMVVTYVHNLAFEFQFLSGIYPFQPEECFFRQSRKPIYCRMYNCFEFRCSYIQSNMSLAQFAIRMGCKTRKQSGQKFDYSKVRFPWSVLTESEIEYCIDDVISLCEAIENEMKRDGDSLRTIPLTSTGYVRRDCKRAIYPIRKMIIEPMLPKEAEYRILRKAFRGGNTHCNRYYTGKIVSGVESVDMSSCYPAQQLTQKFPMGVYRPLQELTGECIAEHIRKGHSVVATYLFTGLELRNKREPIPYLSLSKAPSQDFRVDNGRLLSAGICETTLTEIDLEIVYKQYKFESVAIKEGIWTFKDYLPDCYRDVIRRYYRQKTELKGVSEADIDGVHYTGEDVEYIYMKSKNRLNGIYGMSAQDPVHQDIRYVEGEYIVSDYDSDETTENLKRASFPYQWGVYTTAYARKALQEGINLAGDKIVYCDTDSVKTDGHIDFDNLNVSRETLALQHNAQATDPTGVVHCMGVYEVDGQYKEFISQGAKRYAYITEKKGVEKMGITVSGVTHKKNEKTGETFAVEELKIAGGLKAFKPGMIWMDAGGTTAQYNDYDNFDYTDPETGNIVHISKNVAIVSSTYEMTYSKDYAKLLEEIVLYKEWVKAHE